VQSQQISDEPVCQGILKGDVSLNHWPPVWLVWNQLYDNWQLLFLFAKQTNPNESNRRSMGQWYFPFYYSLTFFHLFKHTRTHTHTHTHAHAYKLKHKHTHTHTHTHTHSKMPHTHTHSKMPHTHTHTHTKTPMHIICIYFLKINNAYPFKIYSSLHCIQI
jgi:hypothetical protein